MALRRQPSRITDPSFAVVPFVGAGSLAISVTGAIGGMADAPRAVVCLGIGVLAVLGLDRLAGASRR